MALRRGRTNACHSIEPFSFIRPRWPFWARCLSDMAERPSSFPSPRPAPPSRPSRVTDVLGWLRLNRWLANLIAIVAVIWSLREFFDIASEEKLMAIANMLCYLQIVMLFQEKTARVYWQLVVLSVLQVVVGAVLDVGPQFGLLLAFYAVLALSTLVLLCIYRAAQQGAISPMRRSPQKATIVAAPARQSANCRRFAVADGAGPQPDLFPASSSGRAAVGGHVSVRHCFLLCHAAAERRRLARGQARRGNRGLSGRGPAARRRPRSSVEQSSDARGAVADDRSPPVHADRRALLPWRNLDRLSTRRARQPLASLAATDCSEGGRRYRSGMLPMAPQTTTNLVRQDIVLEATTSTRRFAIVPTQPLWDMTLIPYGAPPPRSDAEAVLPPRQQRDSVATSAIRNQRQLHAIPNPNRLQTLWDCTAFSDEEQRALAFDQSRFPRVAQMAEEVLTQQELMNGKTLDKILALERHFHAPDLYRYSLNLDFVRDRQLDPIEDFVANHRTGHCQYFASAWC